MLGNPPLRSYNNLKGVEKLENIGKYEKKNRRNVRKFTPKKL